MKSSGDALRHAPGINQASLADTVAKDRATIGAVVDRLVQKGLVARSENRRDRRARILRLTPKGEDLVAVLTPLVEGFQAEILANLDEEERRLFVSLAAKATAGRGGQL